MSIQNLNVVPKLIKQIEVKIEKLENTDGVEKVVLDTNVPTKSGNVNLQDISNLNELVSVHANLKRSYNEFSDSSKTLGLDLEWSLNGRSFDDWEKAIKWRVYELSISTEIKKLKETKSVLEKNMEEEDRKKREIENALKDINLD
jgi:hypothetical protein